MNAPFHASDVIDWTGGSLAHECDDVELRGASIDTRSVVAGELFVAIVGPNHDAHGFLDAAVDAGAGALVVERGRDLPESARSIPVIAVEDTTRALGEIGAGHRAGFDGPVVAITGSNGKTTTKEMCAAILSVAAPCGRTAGNLNNRFGLPLTLLRRREEDRSLVVEIGMNHRGEIKPLAAIAHPNVAVITNVGTAHIEFLGSQDEIALEKGDLVAALSDADVAVLNADDPRVTAQAERTRARVCTFGRSADADLRAESIESADGRFHRFTLVAREGSTAVEIAGLGETTIVNALAAAAAALAAGANLDHVATGLAAYTPVAGRLRLIEASEDLLVIDDTYNASPQSMAVALRSLEELSVKAGTEGSGRAIAVLGSMGELGANSRDAHREVGRLVADAGVALLLALGDHAQDFCDGAVESGLDRNAARVAADHDEALSQLRASLRAGDRVLVKGSRAMRMERVVAGLAPEETR
jgi:UDP-N-acetylmuramoyl-tripeptide--D-alanyl-D-alanine ligase